MQEVEQVKAGVALKDKAVTDSFTKLKKITLLESAYCLLDLSQETHRSAFKLLRSL